MKERRPELDSRPDARPVEGPDADAGLIQGEVDGPRVCYCLEPRAVRRLKALVGGL